MIIKKEVAIEMMTSNTRHKYYQHVRRLTEEYRDIFLCQKLEKYSRRYRQNESEQEHKQRMDIYISVIPSMLAEVDRDFNKPLRSDKIVRKLELGNTEEVNKVWQKSGEFYRSEQSGGVDKFLEQKWSYYAKYDPNAILTIQQNGEEIFPYIYRSVDVLDYQRINGRLEWFIAVDNDDVLLYDDSGIHLLRKIDYHEDATGEYMRIKGVQYDYRFYSNNRAIESSYFCGVVPDPVTENETYVSIFHDGLPYLKKEIQTGSEFDLTIRKHVFPQRAIIGRACTGEDGSRCNEGYNIDGSQCERCGGTGIDITATDSTQQLLVIKEEDERSKQIYPKDIVHYFSPPVELVEFQEKYQDKIHRNFRNAIFSRVLKSADATGIQTATEVKYENNDLLDTLYPFMNKYADLWMHITDEIIIGLGIKNGRSVFKFPAVIFPKTDNEILAELTEMRNSGAPQFILSELQKNWLEQKYATEPDKVLEMQVKSKFQPFFGKTDEEIRMILASGVPEEVKALHNYFHVIFTTIDEEQPDFYRLPYSEQKTIVDAEVEKYIFKFENFIENNDWDM